MPRIIVCNGSAPVTHYAPDGMTPRRFMYDQYPEIRNFPLPTVCLYGGRHILRAQWETTVLTGDEVAVFHTLPKGGGGGGSNPLQAILTVVMMAVAAIMWWNPMGWTAFGLAAAQTGALMATAVMMGGTMLINALVPNNPLASGLSGAAAAEAASPTYSINSNTNQPRMGQVVPNGFGTIEAIPDVVCSPWTRYENNNMYVYQVFGLGMGVYRHEVMFFGGTEFWRNGKALAGSAYVDMDDPYQVYVGETILTAAQGGGWTGPYPAQPPGVVIKEITVKIAFPDDFCSYAFQNAYYATVEDESSGDGATREEWVRGEFVPIAHTFSCAFQIRKVDEAGTPLEGWRNFLSGSWPVNTLDLELADYDKEEGVATYLPKEVTLTGTAGEEPGMYELRGRNTSAYVGTITVQESSQSAWGSSVSIERSIEAKETAVWSVTDTLGPSIQVQIVPPGGKVTLFPDNVETSPAVAGQVLLAPNADGHDWQGPFPVCSPGTVTDRISNDLTFPRGIVRFNDEGKERSISIGWEFQYRRIDDDNQPTGSWKKLHKDSISMATTTPQRRTIDSPVAKGRYQVRVKRTTDTRGDSRTLDEMQWGGMRASLPGNLTYNQTVVALRTKANKAMSNAASERFSVIQTRKLPVYNPATKTWKGSYDARTGTWTDCEPTRSFAAAVAWICKSPWGGRLEDRHIDLDGLWALDAIVEAKGWHYDAWVDGPYNVFALLAEVCGVMRVIPRPGEKMLTFAMDAPNRPVRYEFTPYTIVRGSFKPTWLTFNDNTPDDVSVTYLDEDAGYAKRDVRAVLPGSESREPGQRQPIGIVNRKHAHAYGVHLAACNRYRRIELEFQTEAIGRLLSAGDIISVRHPRFRSLSSGKLADWNAGTLALMLDPVPQVPEGTAGLYISFSRPDGTIWGPVKLNSVNEAFARIDAEDYATLITQGMGSPFEWFTRGYDRMPTIWGLHTSRDFARRMIVKKVVPADKYRHTIHCVNDDPRVYNQNISVPPWEYRPQASTPVTLAAPAKLAVRVAGDGAVLVTWLPVAGATGYEVEYSVNGSTWERKGRTNINTMTLVVPSGRMWVRVCAVNDTLSGPWSVWNGNLSIPVPDAPELTLSAPFVGGALAVSWLPESGALSYTVRVYTEDSGSPILIESTSDTSFVFSRAQAVQKGGPWRTLYVRVTASNLSGDSSPGVLKALDPAPGKILLTNIKNDADSASVTFSLTGASGADVTGYVLARGRYPSFLGSEILETRVVNTLPYTWSGLEPDTAYYFRLAAKDAYFDIGEDFASLNYSDGINIMTESEAEE